MILIILWFIPFLLPQVLWSAFIFYICIVFLILILLFFLLFLFNALLFYVFYDFTISDHQVGLIVFYRKRSVQAFDSSVICFRVLFFNCFWNKGILCVILCLGFKIYLLHSKQWKYWVSLMINNLKFKKVCKVIGIATNLELVGFCGTF